MTHLPDPSTPAVLADCLEAAQRALERSLAYDGRDAVVAGTDATSALMHRLSARCGYFTQAAQEALLCIKQAQQRIEADGA